MDLNKLEQKNINRASRLVVQLERAIGRNEAGIERLEIDKSNEVTRHELAIASFNRQIKELKLESQALQAELAEAKNYLKALTIEQSK